MSNYAADFRAVGRMGMGSTAGELDRIAAKLQIRLSREVRLHQFATMQFAKERMALRALNTVRLINIVKQARAMNAERRVANRVTKHGEVIDATEKRASSLTQTDVVNGRRFI